MRSVTPHMSIFRSNGSAAQDPGDVVTVLGDAIDMVFVCSAPCDEAAEPLITFANGAMLSELGYSSAEFAGKTIALAFGPRTDLDDSRRMRDAIASMNAAQCELRLYRSDGSTFWSDWRGHRAADGIAGAKRWIGIGRNTEERRSSEDQLRTLSTAIESAGDAIFVYSIRQGDTLPHLRYVNPAAFEQTGCTREELNTTARRLGPLSGDETMQNIVKTMRAGEPLERRMRQYRKDGSTYWADVSLRPIPDRKGNFSQWICVERDVSAGVEQEEMRSDLMAMIGHDLRNPLTSILGHAGLLLEGTHQDDSGNYSVRQILIGAKRLQSLATEMLTVSMLEREEYRPRVEAVDVDEMVRDVLSYFNESARVDVPASCEEIIEIENLLSNAIKFSAEDSRIVVTVAGDAGGMLSLRVSDAGIGIPADDLARIFDRTMRARNVGNRRGTGLGLNFVKRLVMMSGGTITVSSTEGRGSTFEVRLPLVRATG
jgi:PAS domain S-box-containing protein